MVATIGSSSTVLYEQSMLCRAVEQYCMHEPSTLTSYIWSVSVMTKLFLKLRPTGPVDVSWQPIFLSKYTKRCRWICTNKGMILVAGTIVYLHIYDRVTILHLHWLTCVYHARGRAVRSTAHSMDAVLRFQSMINEILLSAAISN
jgi:hypothetical protein